MFDLPGFTHGIGGDDRLTAPKLIERLRRRAAIRRKATCRGAEDRLANDLDEAANTIEALLKDKERLL